MVPGDSSTCSVRKADTGKHVNTRIMTRKRSNPLLAGVIIFHIILPINTCYLRTLWVINDRRCRWTTCLNSKNFLIHLHNLFDLGRTLNFDKYFVLIMRPIDNIIPTINRFYVLTTCQMGNLLMARDRVISQVFLGVNRIVMVVWWVSRFIIMAYIENLKILTVEIRLE